MHLTHVIHGWCYKCVIWDLLDVVPPISVSGTNGVYYGSIHETAVTSSDPTRVHVNYFGTYSTSPISCLHLLTTVKISLIMSPTPAARIRSYKSSLPLTHYSITVQLYTTYIQVTSTSTCQIHTHVPHTPNLQLAQLVCKAQVFSLQHKHLAIFR